MFGKVVWQGCFLLASLRFFIFHFSKLLGRDCYANLLKFILRHQRKTSKLFSSNQRTICIEDPQEAGCISIVLRLGQAKYTLPGSSDAFCTPESLSLSVGKPHCHLSLLFRPLSPPSSSLIYLCIYLLGSAGVSPLLFDSGSGNSAHCNL